MPSFKSFVLITMFFSACNSETKETGEIEDCPTIALDCPEGQVPCSPETDNDPCNEVTLGEEPCTQTRYCMPE